MRELYGLKATEAFAIAGQSLTHDTKGNMTLIPSSLRPNATSLALTWDFENKMTNADIGNNSSVDVTYKWDALGRRVYRDDGTSAYVYVQVGQQTIAVYGWGMAPASPKYNYVYASYIDEPVMREEPSANERLFLHRSQQFSVVALTTSSAAIAERYAYSAYGAPTVCNASGTDIGSSVEDNRVTYTGREWDQTLRLYHFRARLYDARVARFLGRDPFFFAENKWNIYQFVIANPVKYTDPFGLLQQGPVVPGQPWPPGTRVPLGWPGNVPMTPNNHLLMKDLLLQKLSSMCVGCDSCSFERTKCDFAECQASAGKIANSIFHTLENNHIFTIPRPYDSRYRGYFCYDWAFAFKDAIESISTSCFNVSIEGSQKWLYFVHYWVAISSPCSDKRTYIDDGFGVLPRGKIFVHDLPPSCEHWGYVPAPSDPGLPYYPYETPVVPYDPNGNPMHFK